MKAAHNRSIALQSAVSGFKFLFVVIVCSLLTGCAYLSDFWNRYWQNRLTDTEFVVFLILFILFLILAIIIVALLAGKLTIGAVIAGIVALLTFLWKVILWPFLVWLFRDVIWWLIRFIAVRVLWRLILKPAWRYIFAPVWRWFAGTQAGKWLIERVTDNAVWDGIKWVVGGAVAVVTWLFSGGDSDDTRKVEIACGTQVEIGPFVRTYSATHRDYPGGKGEPEIIQDAINDAESEVRKTAESELDRMIAQIQCVGECQKMVVNRSVVLTQPTPVTPDRGMVWSSFEAKATATGRATVRCGGE